MFSAPQVEILINEVSQNLHQLFGPNSKENRMNAWREVMEEVNKAGPTSHTIEECRVRWNNYRTALKRQVRRSHQTLHLLDTILSERDMRIVRYFVIDEEICAELEENPPDNLIIGAGPDGGPLSVSHNDRLPSSLLLSSEQPSTSQLPVASDGTTDFVRADESQQRPLDLNGKLEHLIKLQKCNNGLLTSIRDGICDSVDQQKEMLHMQKFMFTQETAKDYSGVYEVSLKRQKKRERHAEDRPLIQRGCREVEEFASGSTMAYRRGRNLNDELVHTTVEAERGPRGRFLIPPRKGNFPCLGCVCCRNLMKGHTFRHPLTGKQFPIRSRYTCNTSYVVYLLTCPCGLGYVGETTQEVKKRIVKHKSTIRTENKDSPVSKHFVELKHSVNQLRFRVIDHVPKQPRGRDRVLLLKQKELKWIQMLDTMAPKGLNLG
ncbi:uncharacterized protein [Eleutherodactylus coqui]|uniref:uncharacterized protein n=1 Tax=Eleutherodactylus coqui TaxID=57060 RepID=UPI00346358A9